MTTRLITAGVILVAAIIFGFIFWNQFSSNQQNLAGGNMPVPTTQTTQTQTPKKDSVSSIETDLNNVDVNSIDSDSSQFNTQLKGF